jgi:hypothetical protein
MFLLTFQKSAMAQETDSSSAISDSLSVVEKNRTHNPNTALIMSAIVPGLGQAYNRKYWKIPIIYGAGGAFVYYIGYNSIQYKKFRDAYAISDKTHDIEVDGRLYNHDELFRGQRYYEGWRNRSVFGLGLVYMLNIIDAMIDAHFFYYDVSDDLTMRIQPTVINNYGLTAAVGVQISFGF